MKNIKLTAASAAVLTALLAGCGASPASNSTFNADAVSCSDVGNQVSVTNAAIQQDQKDVTDGQGTPKASEATNRLTVDNDKLTRLTSRQTSCAASAPPTVPVTSPQPTLTAEQLSTQLAGHFDGFVIGKDPSTTTLRLGNQVTSTAHTVVHGANDFNKGKTLTSPQEVGAFLKSDTAARTRVVDAITAAGYGQSEINRALSGDGFFAVQMTIPSQLYGTSYKTGDTSSAVENGARTLPVDDVLWLFATTDGKIIYGAAVRADCGNPHMERVVPITPSTPWAPPVTCMTTASAGCQPPPAPVTTEAPAPAPQSPQSPPAPVTTKAPCYCLTPTQAQQPVNDPGSPVKQYPGPVAGSPTSRPYSFPGPTPAPSQPAPSPTPGGYSSGGGTGSSPGGSQCGTQGCTGGGSPSPSGTPDSPVPPTTLAGDPGGW